MSDVQDIEATGDGENRIGDMNKRKRTLETTLAAKLRQQRAPTDARSPDEDNGIDPEKKKCKVHSEPRPRSRRHISFGLATIHEVPSPPPGKPSSRSSKSETNMATAVTTALLVKQARKVYSNESDDKIIPPPPPPASNMHAVAGRKQPAKLPSSQPPVAKNKSQVYQRRVAAPPPPVRQAPPSIPPPPLASRNQTKSKAIQTLQDEDTQPDLMEADSGSFELTHDDEPQTIKSRWTLCRLAGTFLGLLVATTCLLLITVSLVHSATPDTGLHIHVMLPPRNSNNMTLRLDEESLHEYWKEHAPSQVVELYDHVASTNQNLLDSASTNSRMLTPSHKEAPTQTPMCMNIKVQTLSDLVAASIKVTFPDIMTKFATEYAWFHPRVAGNQTLDATDSSTALVTATPSTTLESSLLSRISAFSFPFFAWIDRGNQHLLVNNNKETESHHPVTQDSNVMSLEIVPCGTRKRRIQKAIEKSAKEFQRMVTGTTKKVAKGADKLKERVQGTTRKLKQGVGGIKEHTGRWLGGITSWHKTKKWL